MGEDDVVRKLIGGEFSFFTSKNGNSINYLDPRLKRCLWMDENDEREVVLKVIPNSDVQSQIDEIRVMRHLKKYGACKSVEMVNAFVDQDRNGKIVMSPLETDEDIDILMEQENQRTRIFAIGLVQFDNNLEVLNRSKEYIDLSTRINICYQMIDAISEIHRLGVISFDVKPQNFLYRKLQNGQYNIVISDFGLSIILPEVDTLVGEKDILRIHHQRVNTSHYVPPELFEYGDPRHYGYLFIKNRMTWSEDFIDSLKAIDCWSLGCSIAEMIIGDMLFFSRHGFLKNESKSRLYYGKEEDEHRRNDFQGLLSTAELQAYFFNDDFQVTETTPKDIKYIRRNKMKLIGILKTQNDDLQDFLLNCLLSRQPKLRKC
jgi:serine/threonine protein kinase